MMVNMLVCTEYMKNTDNTVKKSVYTNIAFATPLDRG
jgi:hypothetical protein